MVMDSSKWWWIGNHNTTNFSPWLHSTLSDLDAKTKEMLRVIDEDADSFGARAEMYYKKRPELIDMVEDFYRTHRSLAERYDLLRPCSVRKHGSQKSTTTCDEDSSSSWSEACETHEEEYAESEIDDGESDDDDEGEIVEEMESESSQVEIEKLREENKVYSEMVKEKDEEKREAIRQMSVAIQMLKEENSELKKCVVSQRKQQIWKKPFEGLWGKVVGNWVLVPKTDSGSSRELMSL